MDEYIFKSKRNKVSLVTLDGLKFVKKEFLNHGDMVNEEKIYRTLENSKVKMPKLLSVCGEAVYLSYISGKTALELLEAQEHENKINTEIWDCLAETLVSFYTSISQCTGISICLTDVNLRNFIYNSEEKCIYILDFELCGKGAREQDLGNLLAHLYTYSPPYTEIKLRTAAHIRTKIQTSMNLEDDKIDFYIREETAMILKRRASSLLFQCRGFYQ